jgi:glycosyltransferase involved in cell wall biosynthesis
MKILLSSYVFAPSIGGIETVSALLAPEFIKAGHEVILVTLTGPADQVERPYPVLRRPSPRKMLELIRWCDVYFQNNISLLMAWPLLFVRRPWIVAHHTWIRPFGERFTLRARLKTFLLRYSRNATISRAIAERIPEASDIVGNPYNEHVYKLRPEIPRDIELVYLGRLVSDKGVDTLLHALLQLKRWQLAPRLTIIGSGEEDHSLRLLARNLGVQEQVTFTGAKQPEQIARMLNAHQVLVVPSRMPEPFGIVVLEAIASGCVIVASRAGGLPDAVGKCGITYEIGDLQALTNALQIMLTRPALQAEMQQHGREHLENFRPGVVARKYLAVFEKALQAETAP